MRTPLYTSEPLSRNPESAPEAGLRICCQHATKSGFVAMPKDFFLIKYISIILEPPVPRFHLRALHPIKAYLNKPYVSQ